MAQGLACTICAREVVPRFAFGVGSYDACYYDDYDACYYDDHALYRIVWILQRRCGVSNMHLRAQSSCSNRCIGWHW